MLGVEECVDWSQHTLVRPEVIPYFLMFPLVKHGSNVLLNSCIAKEN